MLSRVGVVPDNNKDNLLDATRREWQSFQNSIPNHPLTGIPVEHDHAWPEKIDALALAIPILNGMNDGVEAGRVVLGERFWAGQLSADDRALTLLHESIHLRLADDMWRRTVRVDAHRREQIRLGDEADRTERADIAAFKRKRAVGAFQFLLFPDEVWAELYLRDHHPDWLDRRLVALLRMREANRGNWGQTSLSMPQPLVACWIIYELMRVDLVVALESNQQRLDRLHLLKRDWSADLFQLCQADRVEHALATFGDGLPRPLEADAVSEARFDQYFNAVLAIAPY